MIGGKKTSRGCVRRDAIADSCPAELRVGWAKRVTFLESATIKMQCAFALKSFPSNQCVLFYCQLVESSAFCVSSKEPPAGAKAHQ